MNILRNGIATAALMTAMVFGAPACAQGVPVIDGTTLTQVIAQLQQMRQSYAAQLQELDTMRQELITAQTQLASITGARGIASILNSDKDIKDRLAAVSLNAIQQAALNGSALSGLDGLNETLTNLRKKFDFEGLQDVFASIRPIDRAITEQATAAVTAIATAKDTYTRANASMERINTMIGRIDDNADLKASVDYNTRVMAELAVIMNENLRIQAANTNVNGANALARARDNAASRKFNQLTK